MLRKQLESESGTEICGFRIPDNLWKTGGFRIRIAIPDIKDMLFIKISTKWKMENNEDILEELIEYDKNATATIPQNLGFTISI